MMIRSHPPISAILNGSFQRPLRPIIQGLVMSVLVCVQVIVEEVMVNTRNRMFSQLDDEIEPSKRGAKMPTVIANRTSLL